MRALFTFKALAALLLLVSLPTLAEAVVKRSVGASGLPLPRFASLASSRVNVRTGPGTQYPIRWVYRRAGLPVEITGEFDIWRHILDPDGGEGWAHSGLLATRRTVMIQGKGTHDLHRGPSSDTIVVLRAEPGVVGSFLECSDGWCRVEIDGTRGWLPREALWGVLASD